MRGFFMKNSYTILCDYILVALFFSFPFLNIFRSLDKIHVDFSFLSILSLISLLYIGLTKRGGEIFKQFRKREVQSFLIFLLISLTTLVYAFNIVESIIDLSRFLIFFLILIELYILSKNKKVNILLILLLLLLCIESLKIFSVFLENFNFKSGIARIRELQGFSYNPNIGAFSLAIKIPFLIYSIYISKNRILKLFLGVLQIIVFFDILIISSRGAILALILVLIFLVIYSILKKDKKIIRTMILSVFLFTLSSVTQIYLNRSNEAFQMNKRITNYNDSSVKGRLDYYAACIDKIKENPLIGVGIGNWKILSLKYGKDNIVSYEVPYHAHNDFLHLASEVGIMGSFAYLFIFLFPVYILLLKMKDYSFLSLIIISSILVFIIDSNLNFPRARPYSFMNIISVFIFYNLFSGKKKV